MTREADHAAAATGTARVAAGASGGSLTVPPAIQIKMPNSDPGPLPRARPPSQANTPEGIKQLLRDLMARLDENERRYGDALGGLNEKFDVFSGRTQAIGNEQVADAAAALERERQQARSLAENNDAAETAHQMQKDIRPTLGNGAGRIDRSNGDSPHPDFGNARLAESLSAVDDNLQRSLTACEASKSLGALSQRMDALMRRLDVALDASNGVAALEKIESQLNVLTTGFAETRQIHAKVDAIEDHLLDLVGRAEGPGTASPPSGDGGRLAAIERALTNLNDGAREMDSRTLSALQAMYEVLHSLASQAGVSADAEAEIPSGPPAPGEPDPRPPAEDSYEADSDFIAPAGDSAGVAAAQVPSAAGSKAFSASADRSDKRRPALIAVAVLLLIISAGLLYSRLNLDPHGQPAVEAPHSRNGAEIPR